MYMWLVGAVPRYTCLVCGSESDRQYQNVELPADLATSLRALSPEAPPEKSPVNGT